MIGTILNVITVAIGGTTGVLIGDRLPERIQESVMVGLGMVTLVVGISNALETGNIIIPLFSIGIGVIIGELLNIDAGLQKFGGWLQVRFGGGDAGAAHANADDAHAADEMATSRARFINGFVTATLVFCVGPLTVLGSIQDGMTGDYELLAIKSVLDGFAGLAFASVFGVGVLFSIISIIVIQGGLALVGMMAGSFMTDPMIAEMTATGGMILIGIALILWDIKHPRLANFLPALVIAPLIVAIAAVLGIAIYPL